MATYINTLELTKRLLEIDLLEVNNKPNFKLVAHRRETDLETVVDSSTRETLLGQEVITYTFQFTRDWNNKKG